MQAGEVGAPIQIFPNPQGASGPFSLTGQTCTLHVENKQQAYAVDFPMDVAGDGLSATYTTVSQQDFPVGGTYTIQMWFTQTSPAGSLRKTPEFLLVVGNSTAQ
jgi:hypothetical protein